jgi:uroporphyrinogen decarboxylase
MTEWERFLAFANFQKVDHVPRTAWYCGSLFEKMKAHLGADPYSYFVTDQGGGAGLTPPPGFQFPDYGVFHPGRENGKDGFSIDGNGCGHLDGGFYHFTEYISPLRNAQSFEEIASYPIVSNASWLDTDMKKACDEAHACGKHAHVFIGHMYENAWQVRGYEPFLTDLLTNREWAENILDRFRDNNMRSAIAAAKAGYDCIALGDDVANQNSLMFSPGMWREVMKPRWASVIAAARSIKPDAHFWYHSDGDVSVILDDLVEIGITILNPVQPECMNPLTIRKRFGKRLAFDGCVGTQTTFPFATPEEMRRTVLTLARELNGLNGGLMLAPTHVLEPEVPPENIIAFFKACDEISGPRLKTK